MRSGLPITFMLSAAQVLPALAQAPAPPSDRASLAPGTAAVGPVITCTSLANLRTVLRGANDDPVAAIPVITDPRSDLGCSVLDRKTVTGVADYVALNGRAYECLTLQNTNVCHWTVASSATPTISAPAPPRSAPSAPNSSKSKR